MPTLLTRDKFKSKVFERDGHRCVVCQEPAVDAHHIMERRLWEDGGYYLDNGASLCSTCHLGAERTEISCDQIRELTGAKLILPPHLSEGTYDKWGNPILPNGQRMQGELFFDPSVQKILEPMLHVFTNRVKYPRTYHVPWSLGATSDDKVLAKAPWTGKVVITEKMDGECTTLYRDGTHARSIEYTPHPSRNWLKAKHAEIAHDIPEGFRICGESLYAQHSIPYYNLESYFLVFSIWDRHTCLSWDDTKEWAELLGLKTVPILYEGQWNEGDMVRLWEEMREGSIPREGYVIRTYDSFPYSKFRNHVGKFVRSNHVQTSSHWKFEAVVKNYCKGP